jgi:hypothetical protein
MAPLRPRVASNVCVRCRKNFMPGDRVIYVMIVEKSGYNAETRDLGTWMLGEYEVAHVVCVDPGLEGKLITL